MSDIPYLHWFIVLLLVEKRFSNFVYVLENIKMPTQSYQYTLIEQSFKNIPAWKWSIIGQTKKVGQAAAN